MTPFSRATCALSIWISSEGMGSVPGPTIADQPISGIVFPARHHLWRRRPNYFRPSGSSGTHARLNRQ